MDASRNLHTLSDDTVVIVGGGPVGLILARVLSHHGVKSLLCERNVSTTTYPKMDLTNARSMELFRSIGLADGLREQGVPSHFDQDVLISTGFVFQADQATQDTNPTADWHCGCRLQKDHVLAKWDLPSVDKFWNRINSSEEGDMPSQPWQRLSQAVFEKWLKSVCDQDPSIDLRFGWKVESVREESNAVYTTAANPDGLRTTFVSRYAVGCDGGSSTVRRALGITINGGPVPVQAVLVHFKSRDLTRLHKHGRFWHIFFANPSGTLGGAIIAQDEVDTYTTHLFLPIDSPEDPNTLTSEEVVYRVLGGMHDPFPITIDEILVRSIWRPVIAVTDSWAGPHHRVFLAGDAAHQNIPTGGYGMNMGIADAFDIGWKLASVIRKTGGPGLLRSYETERKPVAARNVARSGDHFQVHLGLKDILSRGGMDPYRVDDDTAEAKRLRSEVADYYHKHDGENKDFGIEMGYRYKSAIVIPDEDDSQEPPWSASKYTPTTWPGSRPPHVVLTNGGAIFDHFGNAWTLLSFTEEDRGQDDLMKVAKELSIPIKRLDLANETHARHLYERDLLLIRPDQHVAWRATSIPDSPQARKILLTVTGQVEL